MFGFNHSMLSFNMVVSICGFFNGLIIFISTYQFGFVLFGLVWCVYCVFSSYSVVLCVFLVYIIYIHVFVCGMYMAILLTGAKSWYFPEDLYIEPN